LVDDVRWAAYCAKQEAIERESQRLKSAWLHPGSTGAQAFTALTGQELNRESNLHDLLKRPQVTYAQLAELVPDTGGLAEPGAMAVDAVEMREAIGEQIEIAVKYAGYVDRQSDEVARLRAQEGLSLPLDFDYDAVQGLSNEVRAKLKAARPETLAQAGRIPGITHAAVSLLLITLKKHGRVRTPQTV
jgi:tRNA uridine 5-carboxymethylaminomethyl modification enzyme